MALLRPLSSPHAGFAFVFLLLMLASVASGGRSRKPDIAGGGDPRLNLVDDGDAREGKLCKEAI